MNSREIALISLFSAIWVASQITLGQAIGQITGLHGLTQRFLGWFLMLLLAEITERFGRVSLMATITASATRIVRYSAALHLWVVGLGYAIGGLTFDILFFIPSMRGLKGSYRAGYLIVASIASGVVTTLPYILFQLFSLGSVAFMVWLPVYLPKELLNLGLNVLGTLTAIVIVPKIKIVFPALQLDART